MAKIEHASAVMSDLSKDLEAAHVTVTTAAPMDHLEAVERAASLCAQYHADGLLIAEGRDEQTVKVIYAVLADVIRYPTHVEFRLDEVGCDGVVHWSKTTTADRNTSGFSSAEPRPPWSTMLLAARSLMLRPHSRKPRSPTTRRSARRRTNRHRPPTWTTAKYLVVPFAQPGLAGPQAGDIMHSFMGKLEARKITATAAAPMDRLTVIATAQSLCTAAGASAIIVPALRIEQSSFHGDSYAELRLDVVGCNGVVFAKALRNR